MTFYNTIDESGDGLKKSRRQTETQKEKILAFFKQSPSLWSPSQILDMFDVNEAILTSVRRAITDLTSDGELKKTDIMIIGPHGKQEHCWRLVESSNLF